MISCTTRVFQRIGIIVFAIVIACSIVMVQLAHADEGAENSAFPKADIVSLVTDDGTSVSGVITIIDGEYLLLTENELMPIETVDGWNKTMLDRAIVAFGRAKEGEHGLAGPGLVIKEQKDAYDSEAILFVKNGEAVIASSQQAFGASAERSFDDVLEDSWIVLEGWLEKALDAGIVTGYKDATGSNAGLFGPDDPMRRGQFFAMLYRASVDDASDSIEPSKYASNAVTAFEDNSDGQFYTAAINWAYNQGIVTGDTDESGALLGTVRPNDPVSRQEMATVLHRFAGTNGDSDDGSYEQAPDAVSVAMFAREGIAWCFSNGVMTGDKLTGKLMPTADATRAQSCKMVVVTFELMKACSDASPAYATLDENGNRI